MDNLTAGFYLIENEDYGWIGHGDRKDDVVPIVKVDNVERSSLFKLVPKAGGIAAIHTSVGKNQSPAGYDVTVIQHGEHHSAKEVIVYRVAEPVRDHEWEIVRSALDATKYMILDSSTLRCWQLPISEAGTQVELYYQKSDTLLPSTLPIPRPPPLGVFWRISPFVVPGFYHIVNVQFGNISVEAPPEGPNNLDIPIVAASNPAHFYINLSPVHPNGGTWNIYIKGLGSDKTVYTDNDAKNPAITDVDDKIVVREMSGIPDIWDFVWSSEDAAFRIKKRDGTCRWTLRDKYRESAPSQEPVRCTSFLNDHDSEACDLWKIVCE